MANKVTFLKDHKINKSYKIGESEKLPKSLADKLIKDGIAKEFKEPTVKAKKS